MKRAVLLVLALIAAPSLCAEQPPAPAPAPAPAAAPAPAPAPAGGEPKAPPARRDEWQYLTRFFTIDAFDEGETAPPPPAASQPATTVRRTVRRTGTPSGGFDDEGNSFSSRALPSGERLAARSARFGRVELLRPPTDGSRSNMLSCEGQEIPVSTKRIFNVVFWLGSAHRGSFDGWVEFRFDDGTTGLGPIGFSDWYASPVHGEEPAFRLPVVGATQQPASGGAALWLQHTPVPAAKRIVAIKLPSIPNARIAAMTLGWRDGVRPVVPPAKARPEPGLVAIFGEPGFPLYGRRDDVGPERLRDALVKAGIPAVILDLEQVRDEAILDPKAYPVLINPYSNCYPEAGEEAIRAYRRAGGAMVHFGVPFTHPVARTAYGAWNDRGHRSDLLSHDGSQALGSGGFREGAVGELSAAPELAEWGLGAVAWDRFLPRGSLIAPYGTGAQLLLRSSLAPTDEVVPLLKMKGLDDDPYAALVRHADCPFAGAVDLWLGWTCFGLDALERPAALTVETVVRGTARILHEKKLIDDDRWSAISSPIAEELRTPEDLAPILAEAGGAADGGGTGRLPAAAPVSRKVLWTRVGGLLDADKVLLASAQGLIHRAGGDVSVWLSDAPQAEARLENLKAQGLVDEITLVEPPEIIARVGHRRAVVVDPDVHGSLNLAAMMAAAEGLLVAYPAHVEEHGLEVAVDLRGLFLTGAEGYAFALENVAPLLDTRAIALVQPDPASWRAIDLVVARKPFVFWMSAGRDLLLRGASEAQETTFAARILARTPVCTPILAFPQAPERDPALTMVSTFGKAAIVTGDVANLSFLSGLRAAARPGVEGAPGSGKAGAPGGAGGPGGGTKLERDKVYVGCVLSDASGIDLLQDFHGPLPLQATVGDTTASAEGEDAGIALEITPPLPPLRAGLALAAGALELCPAAVAGIRGGASGLESVPLGSLGLGTVDLAAYGAAFGAARDRVRQTYWELVDRSMREAGQRFLVLPVAPGNEEIAACARTVKSADVILVEGASGSAEVAAMVEGKPVIRMLAGSGGSGSGGLADLTAERLAAGPFAAPGARPAFTWCWIPPGARPDAVSDPATAPDPSVVLVDPVELAALFREYLERMAPVKVPLIAAGDEWSYEDTGNDLGTAWRDPDFDDAAWTRGRAELGYGDSGEGRPEATVIQYGPDPQNRRPCAYFRRAFEAAEPVRLSSLRLEMLRDDGCIVWLNGAEVARSNMPEGEASYGTFASSAIGGSAELQWQGFDLAPAALRKGRNVIAVEMHQSGGSSTDLSFDLKLTGLEERGEEGQAKEGSKGERSKEEGGSTPQGKEERGL